MTMKTPKPNFEPLAASVLLGPLAYVPEIWRVEKDTIYAAIPTVESGLGYARECLAHHEEVLGRTTLKNKTSEARL